MEFLKEIVDHPWTFEGFPVVSAELCDPKTGKHYLYYFQMQHEELFNHSNLKGKYHPDGKWFRVAYTTEDDVFYNKAIGVCRVVDLHITKDGYYLEKIGWIKGKQEIVRNIIDERVK